LSEGQGGPEDDQRKLVTHKHSPSIHYEFEVAQCVSNYA